MENINLSESNDQVTLHDSQYADSPEQLNDQIIDIADDNEFKSQDEDKVFLSGARFSAIRILSRFERSDSYIDKLLDYEMRTGNLNPMDKNLLNEVVHGVIRWKGKLDWVLVGFYHGDYLKCLNIVKNAMRVALYQILYLDRIPIPAAINESVEIVKRVQGEKTAGIVNGVLRNIARNIDNIRFPDKGEDIIYHFSVMYSHPRWMVKRWLERYGEIQAEKLLFTNNRRPYATLRVNHLKAKPDHVIEVLRNYNMYYFVSPYLKNSIVVKSNKPEIPSLDMFKDGWVTIQDTSASLAAYLAQPKEGDRIADLCAAPGGKAFYLAEMMNDNGKVYAIDQYQSKLKFIEEGAERLGLTTIETMIGDATTIEFEEPLDIVFTDVPCSGLGTLAKKPDIKWKREREDIYVLVDTQRKILENAAKILKPGGVLLYSTCTIEPEENVENIEWFLNKHTEFELDPAENYLQPELCKAGYMMLYPHIHNIDGAFAARLIKRDKT